MAIENITDQEKSVSLVAGMGKYVNIPLLQVADALVDGDRKHYWEHNGEICLIPDFYNPEYMSLAWECHLWMLDKENGKRESPYAVSPKPYTEWWRDSYPWFNDNAQRLWLDEIVSLL